MKILKSFSSRSLFAISSFAIKNATPKLRNSQENSTQTYILNTDQQVQTTDKFLKEPYLPALKN
jgi:hypothetical protein